MTESTLKSCFELYLYGRVADPEHTVMGNTHANCLSHIKKRGVWEIDPMHFFHMGKLSAI